MPNETFGVPVGVANETFGVPVGVANETFGAPVLMIGSVNYVSKQVYKQRR